MSKFFSIEFWIAAQLFIDLVLVMLLWKFLKKLKKIEREQHNLIKSDDLKFVVDDIHQEVLSRIDKVIRSMGEKAAVEMIDRAAKDVIDLLDPVVKGSEDAARTFEHQIKEKQRIVKNLNDALDSRIISINLLMSRAEVILKSRDKSFYLNTPHPQRPRGKDRDRKDFSHPENRRDPGSDPFYDDKSGTPLFAVSDPAAIASSSGVFSDEESDSMVLQQQRIIEMYQKGADIDTIASKLAMPRGEVQLVISLKEKFLKMERQL